MTLTRAQAEAQLTRPGGRFEFETVHLAGVDTKIWKHAPPTLVDILRTSRDYGERTFVVYEDERLSFQQHYVAAARFAHLLVDRFGVVRGDRVAIAMRNVPEWIVAFWGAAAAGAVVVPLNAWWSGEELAYGLADSGSRVVVVDRERGARLAEHWSSLEEVSAVVEVHRGVDTDGLEGPEGIGHRGAGPGQLGWDALMASGRDVLDSSGQVCLPDVAIGPEDNATIFYTSGTTGRAKGALGTHRNICTNPYSVLYVGALHALRSTGQEPTNSGPTVSLVSVPLFHATGCHSALLSNILGGGTVVLMRRWDAGRALELIEREGVTSFGGVATMVMQVLDHPDFEGRDTSSVRMVNFGGAPAPLDLAQRIAEHFPVAVPRIGYGLTETSSVTTMNIGADYLAKPDSVGPPVPVVDLKVVDPTGATLTLGEVGELCIKGPNVVKGYWHRPDATAESFSEGWLHTGDLARIDHEGFVFIVDRTKDMVIRGGENVYCVEIEAVLHQHPAVADAAVIGIPHDTLGEEVGAVVHLRPGFRVDAAQLQEHVASRLARFKVPVRVWILDQPLPRNPGGKLLKRQLRSQLLEI